MTLLKITGQLFCKLSFNLSLNSDNDFFTGISGSDDDFLSLDAISSLNQLYWGVIEKQ